MAYRYPTVSSTNTGGSGRHDHYNNGHHDHRQSRYSSSSPAPHHQHQHHNNHSSSSSRYQSATSPSSHYQSATSPSSHYQSATNPSSHYQSATSPSSHYPGATNPSSRYQSANNPSSRNQSATSPSSHYPSATTSPSHSHSHSHSGYGRSSGSGQRAGSFSSGYGSGYTSPGYASPVSPVLSPTSAFRQYAQSSPPPLSPVTLSPAPSPTVKLFDVSSTPREQTEYERSVEYHQAPDTFPCGHVLCHQCLRKFIKCLSGPGPARCPVCGVEVSGEDVSLASMGLPTENHGEDHGHDHDHDHDDPDHQHQQQQQKQQEAPISLLSNFDEIVNKFNGLQHNLRRLKDESVQSRSMGMTYTNTLCHLCRQSHPTLRVIQEHNQLEVRHERPASWNPHQHYFYRLQQGKVVTTFYSKVHAATICVPCTYRELRESKAILPPEVHQALPDVDPGHNQQLALAEVGKIMAKNTAPLMALKGKNVVEVDHKVRVRERADHFHFTDTAEQIEQMVRRQEENLLRHATKQVRDTGQLYHVRESNEVEVDNDETLV